MANNMNNPTRKKDPLDEFESDIAWSIVAYLARIVLLIIVGIILSMIFRSR